MKLMNVSFCGTWTQLKPTSHSWLQNLYHSIAKFLTKKITSAFQDHKTSLVFNITFFCCWFGSNFLVVYIHLEVWLDVYLEDMSRLGAPASCQVNHWGICCYEYLATIWNKGLWTRKLSFIHDVTYECILYIYTQLYIHIWYNNKWLFQKKVAVHGWNWQISFYQCLWIQRFFLYIEMSSKFTSLRHMLG